MEHERVVESLAPPAFCSSLVANTPAFWSVELNCECPKCGEYVNLLDAPDFWEDRTLDIPEHGTENSNNLEVQCPVCDHEFKVCCGW